VVRAGSDRQGRSTVDSRHEAVSRREARITAVTQRGVIRAKVQRVQSMVPAKRRRRHARPPEDYLLVRHSDLEALVLAQLEARVPGLVQRTLAEQEPAVPTEDDLTPDERAARRRELTGLAKSGYFKDLLTDDSWS
jgi:hypothetical protein